MNQVQFYLVDYSLKSDGTRVFKVNKINLLNVAVKQAIGLKTKNNGWK